MDKQSRIVPRASLQLDETESLLYHQLVLAYITPGPSVKGRRGYCQSFPRSYPASDICDADHLMEGFRTQQNDKKSYFFFRKRETTTTTIICEYKLC